MVKEFTAPRERTLQLVKAIPGINVLSRRSILYLPRCVCVLWKDRWGDGDHQFRRLQHVLLNTAHVSSVMGDAFGEPAWVRFSFANSMPNIEKAWGRIKDAWLIEISLFSGCCGQPQQPAQCNSYLRDQRLLSHRCG